MGGDLLDAVDDLAGMAVYVADVAGHGIQAGVFVGMVSSVRTVLLRPGPLARLLGDLTRIVFKVKTTPATRLPGFDVVRTARLSIRSLWTDPALQGSSRQCH